MEATQSCGIQTSFTTIHDVVDEILKSWPDGPGEYEALPLLMLCNNNGDLTQQAFLHFTKRFLSGVVIDMKEVPSFEAVEKLLGEAKNRRLPVILDIPPALAPDISRLQQTASPFTWLSVLFSGSVGAICEEAFDLVFSPRWLLCGADMPLVAALLAERTGGTNFTSHLELMAVQTARRLFAANQNPTSTLDLHVSVQPLFAKLLANCKAHIQTDWPALSTRGDAFLMGCLMECFEKRPDRILSLWPVCVQDAFNKLSQEREGAEFGTLALTQKSRQFDILKAQTWWPFDDNRLLMPEEDRILATPLSTGKLTAIATIAPHAGSLPCFWEFVRQKKPGVIVSLSRHGDLLLKEGKVKEANLFSLFSEISRDGHTTAHLYHLLWQDMSTIPPEQLYHCIVKTEAIRKGSPPLIHCQAGLGRTGTFLAAYEIYLRHRAGDLQPDIFSIVLRLNMQRHGMVQTPAQFESLFTFLSYLQDLNEI